MFKNIIALIMFFLIVFPLKTSAAAQTMEELGGTVEAQLDGKVIHFPALKTDIEATLEGDLASIKVIQTFANPTTAPLHATYLFPLNKDAAVHAMRMEVGDEIIEAEIKKIEEAEKTFDQAKREGKAAALLTQHRPNMFTQKIANLMPGLPVKITLQYTQTVPKVDGDYELVIPLIVGPRYQPERTANASQIIDGGVQLGKKLPRSDIPFGQWEIEALPQYPDVAGLTIPDTIEKDRVSIKVNLQAGVPIGEIKSLTHALNITGEERSRYITLADGRTIDNRDFVLHYRLAGKQTQSGFLASRDERGGFFSLLIEPPAAPESKDITPREMVFVLDTSGSMSGAPIDASKTFMRHALNNLRETDYFRIIRFSNNASEFTSGPVPATSQNLAMGLAYVNSLYAAGGTEIPSAIEQAFAVDEAPGTLRIVTFLTDGYIGNESEVLRLITEKIGNARIYAFGVGTSVNHYLLSEMGRVGRGFSRFIDPTENPDEVAVELAKKLEAPVLTDISIDWGDLAVQEVTPAIIPDLFGGDSIRIQGKFTTAGEHTVRINGKVRGAAASMPLRIMLPEASNHSEVSAIPIIWARSQIADLMRQINTPSHMRAAEASDDLLKAKVVDLGLSHALATKWTSFVAVSKKVVNRNPSIAKEAQVPLPMVKGVTAKAYGEVANAALNAAISPTIMAQNFQGSSVPEPEHLGTLVVMALAGWLATRRRKRQG